MAYSTRTFLVGTLFASVLMSGCTLLGSGGASSSQVSVHSSSVITQGTVNSGNATVQVDTSLRNKSLLRPELTKAQVLVATSDSAFGQCRRELSSLRLIAPTAYTRRKAAFDQLINRAAVYARVRGDINNETQDVVDALYQYQTRELCIRIQRDVIDGLLLRAGDGDERN